VPKIIFINPDDTEVVVEAETGRTLMEVAINGGVSRIIGECGGSCQCATCHVYITDSWRNRISPMSPEEEVMLDNTMAERRSESRLSCQIKVEQEHDGLVVRLPERQI
jgi:ferredoxin, 2Fe-2S